MNRIILSSVSALLLFSCVAQPAVFAAYGGWGGGSSIAKSSLKRDVCPWGDKSASYYDGTCVEKVVSTEKIVLVKEETAPQHPVTDVEEVITQEELRDLVDKIEERKDAIEKIEKKLTTMQRLKVDLIERKVDSLMDSWSMLDDEKKMKKAVLLETRVRAFLAANKNVHPLLASIAIYIQQMALEMVIGIQTERSKVLSIASA